MSEAYILDIEPPDGETAIHDLATSVLNCVGGLTERTRIRPTDIHDMVLGFASSDDGSGSRLLQTLNSARLLGGGITCYLVDRGGASGLQALGLAASSVLSHQQDVVLALGVQPQPEPSELGPQRDSDSADKISRTAGVAAALIAGEQFTLRSKLLPKARIRRFVTASAFSDSRAEGMAESAIRLLMNETINVGDVDLWEVYDGSPTDLQETISRLGLDFGKVNAGGGCAEFGDVGAAASFRSATLGLSLLARYDLSNFMILAPGCGNTGVAMLIERL